TVDSRARRNDDAREAVVRAGVHAGLDAAGAPSSQHRDRHGASAGFTVVLPQAAAVAFAVVMFALIYDPFHAGAVAFIALTPLTLVFTNPSLSCSLGRAALCGFGFGLTASMAIVGPWMYSATADYFGHGSLWSFGFTLFVNALYVAAFQVP